MYELLKKTALLNEGILKFEESSWFNGRAFFPLVTYSLMYLNVNWTINLLYVYKKSNYSKQRANSYGFTDENIVTITATTTKIKADSFIIKGRTIFNRIFKTRQNFRVITSDKLFKLELEKCTVLNDLYYLVENGLSDFNPKIRGSFDKSGYRIDISYNSIPTPIIETEKILHTLEYLINKLNGE
jgi:hypothetical protein